VLTLIENRAVTGGMVRIVDAVPIGGDHHEVVDLRTLPVMRKMLVFADGSHYVSLWMRRIGPAARRRPWMTSARSSPALRPSTAPSLNGKSARRGVGLLGDEEEQESVRP
jgi:hypothetical protein